MEPLVIGPRNAYDHRRVAQESSPETSPEATELLASTASSRMEQKLSKRSSVERGFSGVSYGNSNNGPWGEKGTWP